VCVCVCAYVRTCVRACVLRVRRAPGRCGSLERARTHVAEEVNDACIGLVERCTELLKHGHVRVVHQMDAFHAAAALRG
jgi:hypothetical protein